MTGRLRFGKMSIDIRDTASRLPSATVTTATITVNGRRMANEIGFMKAGPRVAMGERQREVDDDRPLQRLGPIAAGGCARYSLYSFPSVAASGVPRWTNTW